MEQKRVLAWSIAFVGTVAALTILYTVNPSTSILFPPCPYYRLTGFYCPGCGSTRALHSLLHGDFLAAIQKNPIIPFVIPVLIALSTKREWRYSHRVSVAILCVVILFGILRNIPAFPFTLLAPH